MRDSFIFYVLGVLGFASGQEPLNPSRTIEVYSIPHKVYLKSFPYLGQYSVVCESSKDSKCKEACNALFNKPGVSNIMYKNELEIQLMSIQDDCIFDVIYHFDKVRVKSSSKTFFSHSLGIDLTEIKGFTDPSELTNLQVTLMMDVRSPQSQSEMNNPTEDHRGGINTNDFQNFPHGERPTHDGLIGEQTTQETIDTDDYPFLHEERPTHDGLTGERINQRRVLRKLLAVETRNFPKTLVDNELTHDDITDEKSTKPVDPNNYPFPHGERPTHDGLTGERTTTKPADPNAYPFPHGERPTHDGLVGERTTTKPADPNAYPFPHGERPTHDGLVGERTTTKPADPNAYPFPHGERPTHDGLTGERTTKPVDPNAYPFPHGERPTHDGLTGEKTTKPIDTNAYPFPHGERPTHDGLTGERTTTKPADPNAYPFPHGERPTHDGLTGERTNQRRVLRKLVGGKALMGSQNPTTNRWSVSLVQAYSAGSNVCVEYSASLPGSEKSNTVLQGDLSTFEGMKAFSTSDFDSNWLPIIYDPSQLHFHMLENNDDRKVSSERSRLRGLSRKQFESKREASEKSFNGVPQPHITIPVAFRLVAPIRATLLGFDGTQLSNYMDKNSGVPYSQSLLCINVEAKTEAGQLATAILSGGLNAYKIRSGKAAELYHKSVLEVSSCEECKAAGGYWCPSSNSFPLNHQYFSPIVDKKTEESSQLTPSSKCMTNPSFCPNTIESCDGNHETIPGYVIKEV